jgi:hypothetical protein
MVPVPVGEVADTDVELLTLKAEAAPPPKLTAVALVNPVPVIVTVEPPPSGPQSCVTPVTVGGAVSGRAGVFGPLDRLTAAVPEVETPLLTVELECGPPAVRSPRSPAA